jgi:hypothetical protein
MTAYATIQARADGSHWIGAATEDRRALCGWTIRRSPTAALLADYRRRVATFCAERGYTLAPGWRN